MNVFNWKKLTIKKGCAKKKREGSMIILEIHSHDNSHERENIRETGENYGFRLMDSFPSASFFLSSLFPLALLNIILPNKT